MRNERFVSGKSKLGLLSAIGLYLALVPAWGQSLPDPYTRIVEDSARHYRLEVAARRMEAPGKPGIWLVGMVHHGSFDFFHEQQEFLASMPFVLVEDNNLAVGPQPDDFAEEEDRQTWTTGALQFAGSLVEGYRETYQSYPTSIGAVVSALQPESSWAANLRLCMVDAWGKPVAYHRTGTGYELISSGGGGDAEPIKVSHAPVWRWTDIDEERLKIRDELGLVEQSNGGLDFNHENLHLCDMPRTEYDARSSKMRPLDLAVNTEAATACDLAAKYPRNLQAQRFLIMQRAGTPHVQDVLQAQGKDHLVLIERNDVVWNVLQKRIAAKQPVCVCYGAAHMYDLENRLVTQEGYAPAETRWLPVFETDLSGSKISDAEIEQIRNDAATGKFGIY